MRRRWGILHPGRPSPTVNLGEAIAMEEPRSFEHLQRAVEAAEEAASLDAALQGLIGVLRLDFDVWGAGIMVRVERDGNEFARIAALWSATETPLEPGVDIPTNLTPELEAISEVIRSGRPTVIRMKEQDLGMLGELSRKQGSAVSLIVPIADQREVIAALALSSGSDDGFTVNDLPFFTGLGKGIQASIVRLLALHGLSS